MGNRFWRTWPVVVGAILISTFAYVQGRRAPERATVSGQASSYAGGRFALLMDGEVMGFLKSVSGGIVRTDPATHDLGPRRTLRRNAKLLAIKPVAIDVGMGMSEAFYEWIEMAFDGEFARRTGQIHAVDFDMQSKSVREFRDARIVEVTFPELDGSSKDPAYMTVKLAPEKMISGPGTGQTIKGEGADRRKQWLCSNFRIEVGDFPCDLVSKIDSFTWKQAVTKDEVGQFREPALHPTKVEIPNIKLTISTADSASWQAWFDQAMKLGANPQAFDGVITFLAPDMKTALARVALSGLTPFVYEVVSTANQAELASFTVELRCEGMAFTRLAE